MNKAVLEFNEQELKYLLHGVAEFSRAYTLQGGSRDYYLEDNMDELRKKLEKALDSLSL